MNKNRWTTGNRARLLENGEDFFPAVFEAVRSATHEVIIETFILFEDKVGQALRQALLGAARRGAQVDVMVDGFGSSELTPGFVRELTAAGVRVRSFDPSTPVFGLRTNVLRRMHRKLVVVDGRIAFVGGINYSADHLADFGPQAKQDYAVELGGPIVGEIRHLMLRAIDATRATDMTPPSAPGEVEALLVTRDNLRHPTDIERHYRAAIRTARPR